MPKNKSPEGFWSIPEKYRPKGNEPGPDTYLGQRDIYWENCFPNANGDLPNDKGEYPERDYNGDLV